MNRAVHRDAIEVGVQELVRHRIELILLDQHARVAPAGELQRDERVGARLRVKNPEQRARLYGNRRRLFAVAAVEHGGHAAVAPRAARLVLAETVARCRL